MTSCSTEHANAGEETGVSWVDVVSASEPEVREPSPQTDAPMKPGQICPEAGDVIMHPKHGACTVYRVGGGVLQFAPQTGRLLKLSLEHLNFSYIGDEGNRRVFSYSPKSRK